MNVEYFRRAAWGCALGLALQSGMASAASNDLTVVIKGIKNDKGQIMVCLFDQVSTFPSCEKDGTARRLATKAKKGQLSFIVRKLPDGDYAISIAHDQNGDNKIERHLLFGYPTEGAGTSNYAKPPRSKPEFEKARFRLSGGAKSIEIKMHYP